VLIDLTTFKEYRLEAQFSLSQLAKAAHLNRQTVTRADDGKPIQDVKAVKLVQALSEKLGRKIELKDIEDLKIL
jgi:predicted transcriptional regulator